MKPKPIPIESEHHSKIILSLVDGAKNLSQIAEIMDKDISTIKEQMDLLIEKHFIIKDNSPKENRYKNSKSYCLNWQKILSEYLEYLQSKSGSPFSNSLIIKMKINPYLKEIFVRTFNDHYKIFKKKKTSRTIEQLFEAITMQIIYRNPPNRNEDLKELAEKDKSLHTFLEFTEVVGNYLATDFEDLVEDLYQDIRDGDFTNEKNSQKK